MREGGKEGAKCHCRSRGRRGTDAALSMTIERDDRRFPPLPLSALMSPLLLFYLPVIDGQTEEKEEEEEEEGGLRSLADLMGGASKLR